MVVILGILLAVVTPVPGRVVARAHIAELESADRIFMSVLLAVAMDASIPYRRTRQSSRPCLMLSA